MNRIIIMGILLPCTLSGCWWGRPEKQDAIDKKKRPSFTVVRMVREDSRMFPYDDTTERPPMRGGRRRTGSGARLERQLSTVNLYDVDITAHNKEAQNLDTTSNRTWWSWICCCCLER